MRHQHATTRASLWASVSEGRPPQDGEVQSFAAKIWQEAYRRDSGLAWTQVEVGSLLYRRSVAAALAALGAMPLSA